MKLEMTRRQLIQLLFTRGTAHPTLPDGTRTILNSVEREDGSGNCFNLKCVLPDQGGRFVEVFCRVTD